jgi:hypothetical protein
MFNSGMGYPGVRGRREAGLFIIPEPLAGARGRSTVQSGLNAFRAYTARQLYIAAESCYLNMVLAGGSAAERKGFPGWECGATVRFRTPGLSVSCPPALSIPPLPRYSVRYATR